MFLYEKVRKGPTKKSAIKKFVCNLYVRNNWLNIFFATDKNSWKSFRKRFSIYSLNLDFFWLGLLKLFHRLEKILVTVTKFDATLKLNMTVKLKLAIEFSYWHNCNESRINYWLHHCNIRHSNTLVLFFFTSIFHKIG